MEITEKDPEKMQDPKSLTAVYDPNKPYEWKPQDVFYIPGNEFGVLLNALRTVINSPLGQAIILADRANDIAEASLARAVQAGIAVEKKTYKEIPKMKVD